MQKHFQMPPILAAISQARDHLDTHEFATAFDIADSTVRKNHCLTGACYGVIPVKAGNKLLWPLLPTAAALNGIKAKANNVAKESGHGQEN